MFAALWSIHSFLAQRTRQVGTMAMRALKARLGTAQQLLGQFKGKANFELVSRVQAHATKELMLEHKCHGWQPSIVAEITDLVLQVDWFGEHGDDLLAVLTQTAPEPAAQKASRRKHKTSSLS